MHAEIYRSVKEAEAVLHTHSAFAAAFAVAGKPIPEILPEMTAYLKSGVPVCEYAPAGSLRLAETVAETLKLSPACLMRNHGLTVYGESPYSAYMRAVCAEEAAKIFIFSGLTGKVEVTPSAD